MTRGPLKFLASRADVVLVDAAQPQRPVLGEMLVSRGFLSEAELERALALHDSTGEPLGEIVRRLDLVSPGQLAELLALQRAWQPLGQLLLSHGLLTEEQLAECLDEQERTGRRLGDVVTGCGLVSPHVLERVLDEQYRLELEVDRGFGAGLRDELERRHRIRRGLDEADTVEPPSALAVMTPVAPSLSARLDSLSATATRDRIAVLQDRLEQRERTIESLGAALNRKTEEVDRLHNELAERDAIIDTLRRRAPQAESEPASSLHRLRAAGGPAPR